jgi:hypothetical protein
MRKKVIKKGGIFGMLIQTVIMALLAVILLAIGYSERDGQHLQDLNSGLIMIVGIIPLLLFAFIAAGMIRVLLSQEVSRWIGEESGFKGILIGILGWKFAMVSLIYTFFFPPITGLIGQFAFSGVK